MFARILALLKLLARSTEPPATGQVAVRELVVPEDGHDDGRAVHVELPQFVERWGQPLLDGYERSRAFPDKLILGLLRNQHKQQIRRELKQIVVDTMSLGADVQDLTTDAVPVIAYALLIESLPTAVVPGSPQAAERVNDVLLEVSAGSHELPSGSAASPLFVDLFKLSVALGEAQRYAEQLSLADLRVDPGRKGSRFSRRSVVVSLLVACGTVAVALAGFTIGAAGTRARSAAVHRTTITRQRVVTHTAPAHTTTVIRQVPKTKLVDHTKTIANVSTVTVTTPAPAPTPTPTPTPTPVTPKVVIKPIVPTACASAVANARNVAQLAADGFSEFSTYARLASEAIPAALAHDSAKMAVISNQTQALGATLSHQANQITHLDDAVSAAATACR